MFNVVFTDEGRALIAEIASDIDYSLLISDVKYSEHDYTGQEASVTEATFTGDFASGTKSISVVDSTTMRIETYFNNQYINEQKELYTIGIFAKCVKPNGMIYTEIDSGLLAVCTVSTPRIIPPYADAPFSVFSYNINLAVGSADNVTVVETQAGVQYKELTTPITINGNTESTVEDALDGLNDYGDALKDNLAANENVYGAKNRNIYPYEETTKTENGLTFNDNGNGTITVSAASYPYTVPTDTYFICHNFLGQLSLEQGDYILSGSPIVSNDIYVVFVYYDNGYNEVDSKGTDQPFYLPLKTNNETLRVFFGANSVITEALLFKPMIRDSRIIDPTFAPFAETNLQLTRKTSGVSNRNLLDNPWFTVNQRGATTVTSGYGADRWFWGGGISGSNIVFAPGSATLTNVQMQQYFEKQIPNGVYTLSVKKSDGTIYHGTINKTDDVSSFDAINNADVYVAYNATYKSFVVSTYGKNTNTFVATKLEVGSVSTLHLDVAPDPATELLKCQRYFYRVNQEVATAMFAFVMGLSATAAYAPFRTPVPMRATPSISFGGTFNLVNASDTNVVSTISFSAYTGDLGTLSIGSSNLTPSNMYILTCGLANSYIDFNSEL